MVPDFFTREPRPTYSVPHDRIGLRWILLIHLAITRSFELIRAECELGKALENAISEKLEDALENRVRNRGEVEGFDSLFFGKITRGSEVVNYNGIKIGKKPDLVFQLRRESRADWDQRQDALFAECKPVGKKHPLSGHYCAVGKDCTGIERFIIGDYAWSMEEALMIGYVRDGLSIDPHLVTALNDDSRRLGLGNPSSPRSIEAEILRGTETPIYLTTHQRGFTWKDGRAATPIDVFHSWHDCQ